VGLAVRRVNPDRPDEDIIREMAWILKLGNLIIFPTETFYGLGAHALNRRALERIYRLKERPRHLPMLCLVDGRDRLAALAKSVPPWVQVLMEAFWPGPLTLVLPGREDLPEPLLGVMGGVAVRWSPHPVAQLLPTFLEAPVVGTSANLSGERPPTRVQELTARIRHGVMGILDGGATPGGAPSTVLDCTDWPARVVREGVISRKALEPFLPC
jgi:L-threonylcarbamoyladenylate synthase